MCHQLVNNMVTPAEITSTQGQRKNNMVDCQDSPNQLSGKSFSTIRLVTENAGYLLFLLFLALLYIRNAHYTEELIRHIEQARQEVKEKRWEYMTIKAELMSASKQTEVARLVKTMGLKELHEPPRKIKIDVR